MCIRIRAFDCSSVWEPGPASAKAARAHCTAHYTTDNCLRYTTLPVHCSSRDTAVAACFFGFPSLTSARNGH